MDRRKFLTSSFVGVAGLGLAGNTKAKSHSKSFLSSNEQNNSLIITDPMKDIIKPHYFPVLFEEGHSVHDLVPGTIVDPRNHNNEVHVSLSEGLSIIGFIGNQEPFVKNDKLYVPVITQRIRYKTTQFKSDKHIPTGSNLFVNNGKFTHVRHSESHPGVAICLLQDDKYLEVLWM